MGSDIVVVFTKKPAPEGWIYCDNRGKIGLVPQSFLVPIEAQTSETMYLRHRVWELEQENRVLRQRDLMYQMRELNQKAAEVNTKDESDGPKLSLMGGFDMHTLEALRPLPRLAPARATRSRCPASLSPTAPCPSL